MKIQDSNVLINNTYILSPPLANIIPFVFLLNIFKIRLLKRDLHTLINNVSFSSPTNVRSIIHPLTNIVLFVLPLNVFKICLLGRDFHTLINNVLFSSPIEMRSHNPSPLGPDTHLLLQSMWDPPFGPNVLAGTSLDV